MKGIKEKKIFHFFRSFVVVPIFINNSG